MALRNKSSFLYGFQVTNSNNSLDFKAASGGPTLQATLTQGYYSLEDLMTEVIKQMQLLDTANTYSFSIDRTFSSGTQNRVTISTNGAFLSLLFSSGPRAITSCATLLGYTATDKTGATSYQSQNSAGTFFQPTLVGYNYLPPTLYKETMGSVNLSTYGVKEVVTYAQFQFIQVQFKYEPEATAIASWQPLLDWLSFGKPFEFTPDYTSPSTVYNCTLEKTAFNSKGIGYQMMEMLPEFPFFYDTGKLIFRLIPTSVTFQ